MKNRTLATLILTIIFLSIVVIPIVRFGINDGQQNRSFVTSKGSKYCYPNGHINRSIKPSNYDYYPTLALCGKPLK